MVIVCYSLHVTNNYKFLWYQCTALYVATHNGHTEIVQLLLKFNADPNICTKVSVYYVCNNYIVLSYLYVIYS